MSRKPALAALLLLSVLGLAGCGESSALWRTQERAPDASLTIPCETISSAEVGDVEAKQDDRELVQLLVRSVKLLWTCAIKHNGLSDWALKVPPNVRTPNP